MSLRLARIARLVLLGLPAALAALYLAAGVSSVLLISGEGMRNAVGNQIGTDFTAFYTAAHEATHGRVHEIYDEEQLRRAHSRVVGVEAPIYRWTYPPFALLFFAPLPLLPPAGALAVWLVVTLLWLIAAVTWVARWRLAPLLVLLFPGVGHAILTGPTGTLTAALIATLAATLDRHAAVAGVVLATLAYKPHLAVLLPVCLLVTGRFRPLVWAAAMLGVFVAASVAFFGVEPWTLFLANVPSHFGDIAAERIPWVRLPTPFVGIRHATGSATAALSAQTACTVVAVAAVAAIWRRARDAATRWLALGAGAMLASPYALDYDAAALVLPFVLIAHETATPGPVLEPTPLLLLLWLTPVAFALLSQSLDQQIGSLAFVSLLACAAYRAFAARIPEAGPGATTSHPPR